jgi:ATP-binding protein involved in chromosome partitioning
MLENAIPISMLSFIVILHPIMITEKQVIDALRHVDDPDLKKDLVTLNMVKNIQVQGNTVSFTVVLTTPACPMKDMIRQACETAIHHLVDKNADVIIEMTAEVSSGRPDKSQVLPGVRNIIAVASGKGGVGKSTVSMNLAIALAASGSKVGIMDADIYGPSLPIMSGLEGEQPLAQNRDGKQWIQPLERFGIKMMSIGFLVPSGQAIVWRGPMASKALGQFITDVDWGDLDYLVIDLPPGTGDIHLSLVQYLPLTGVVIVTTPQAVALADAKKGLAMFQNDPIKVPILGIVENMAWFTPPELPDKKYYLFGKDGGKMLAIEKGVTLLGQVPIEENLRTGGDIGMPAALETGSIAQAAFHHLAGAVAQEIAILNANVPKLASN